MLSHSAFSQNLFIKHDLMYGRSLRQNLHKEQLRDLYIQSPLFRTNTTIYVTRMREKISARGIVMWKPLRQRPVRTWKNIINPLTPNDPYRGRTAPLTSKRCILYIYSTNIGTEYFKHPIYYPFFPPWKCTLFHNSNVFGSCIIHILYTGCAKIKKIIPAPKG